jgi:hypothetical protein
MEKAVEQSTAFFSFKALIGWIRSSPTGFRE